MISCPIVTEKSGGVANKVTSGRQRLAIGQNTALAVRTVLADTPSKARTIWKHYTRISSKNGTTKRMETSGRVTASLVAIKRSGGFATRDMSDRQWSITGQAAAPAVRTAPGIS